jgi:hypothetical protein
MKTNQHNRVVYSPVTGPNVIPTVLRECGQSDDCQGAGARNRIGSSVFKRFHRVRVSHAADSNHSVNRPQAGEVVHADTTARGYSTWGDAHEARLECELPHTQPCVQLGWTGDDGGQRRFTFDDVTHVQSIVSHHRKNDSPRRLGAKTGGRTLRNIKKNGAEKVIRYLVCQQGCG